MNYMDDHYFLAIRKGIAFYYFGNGCIADYDTKSIAYLDDRDICLVHLCNGTRTLSGCIAQLKNIIDINEIQSRIKRLKRKGVLIIQEEPYENSAIFFGERGLYFPKRISIELTSCCNYKCHFCYKDANANGKYISDDDMDNIINIVGGKIETVTFTGGEPTLHPHMLRYIDQFSEKIPRITMITNGSQLYKFSEHASILQKVAAIQFSMYGRSDDEYRRLMGVPEGFTNLQRSIDFARKNGIGVHLSLTLSEDTIDDIEDYVEVAKKISPDLFIIGFADNYGRGEKIFSDEYVQKIRVAMRTIDSLRRKNAGVLNILKNYAGKLHGYNNENEDVMKNVYRGALACGAGSENLVISSSGKIRACHYFPEEIFSVSSKDALYEHIHGDFHIEHLTQAISKYLELRKYDNYKPCDGMIGMK